MIFLAPYGPPTTHTTYPTAKPDWLSRFSNVAGTLSMWLPLPEKFFLPFLTPVRLIETRPSHIKT